MSTVSFATDESVLASLFLLEQLKRSIMSLSNYGVGSKRTTLPKELDAAQDSGDFDYSDSIPIETSQVNAANYWIRPIGGVVNQHGPFTFCIEASENRYILLNRAFLEMKCRITKEDGTECKAFKDVVAPINMVGSCMWSSIEVFLNQQAFNSSSSVHTAYKAYIETVLSYDSDARNTHMNAQFFHLDSPHHYDTMTCGVDFLKKRFVKAIYAQEIGRPVVPANLTIGANADGTPAYVEDEDPAQAVLAETITVAELNAAVDGSEEKKAIGRRMLYQQYFKDQVPEDWQKITDFAHSGDKNIGFINRLTVTCGSHPWDMYVPLTHDFFRLSNHIAPGNKIDIKLTRHPDSFILNTHLIHMKYKLVIDDMKLHFRTLERPRVATPMVERYLMNETQMHRQVVAANTPSINFRIHYGGVLPKTIIVAFVDTRAADGNYMFNPFNLQHFKCKKISLMINNDEHPRGGLEMDFSGDFPLVARAYHWMFENTGAEEADKGNVVSWQAFQGGCTIWPFDLTPDKCNSAHNHQALTGQIDLNVEWREPLPHPIYVLYEKVYPKVVINDKQKGIVSILNVG